MTKEYQSEKSPIIDSQKSKKTRRKLLKMIHIKASKVDQMFCNTLYDVQFTVFREGTTNITHLLCFPCRKCQLAL